MCLERTPGWPKHAGQLFNARCLARMCSCQVRAYAGWCSVPRHSGQPGGARAKTCGARAKPCWQPGARAETCWPERGVPATDMLASVESCQHMLPSLRHAGQPGLVPRQSASPVFVHRHLALMPSLMLASLVNAGQPDARAKTGVPAKTFGQRPPLASG